MELTPTTELEAVNEMLKAIGETPINSLDNIGFTDAAIAYATLQTKAREVQTRGWYFNRDSDYYFTPAADGRVVLPSNVLSVRPARSEGRRIVPRGRALRNATNNTDIFPLDDGPVVEIIWMFDFEALPEAARQYIYVVATTKFQANVMGSETTYKFTKDDEALAYGNLVYEERLYEERGNMFNDSTDVSEVFTR